jgi:drug/metabolite transporter (DMT)-like permease
LLFTVASALVLTTHRMGGTTAEIVTVGYIYMPIAVLLSYYVFRRRYGNLEWISVGMMTLGVLAFVLLREESMTGHSLYFSVPEMLIVLTAVLTSVMGSILAERVFKTRSYNEKGRGRFYIMKFHLDLSALSISFLLWTFPTSWTNVAASFFEEWARTEDWFGEWSQDQYIMVGLIVAQGWAAGMVTKEFSTVIRSIVQTLASVLIMLLGDPLRGNRFNFMERCVPSILLAVIILMSAMAFQTGRVNLKVIRKAFNITAEADEQLQLSPLAVPEDTMTTPVNGDRIRCVDTSNEEVEAESEKPIESASLTPTKRKHFKKGCEDVGKQVNYVLTTYALILLYIISDAARTLLLQKALSTTVTNSSSMGFVCYLLGSMIASILSLYTHGLAGLRRAWNFRKILQCLPASFLFALATTLGNLAFAYGISSALYVILGKFYIPVAALGARWIMGKFYMWLEWLALLILTLSSAVLGYLKAYSFGETAPEPAPLTAMLLVLGSATVSACSSLVTENIMKGETEPFHVLKVRLDVGSVLSSLILLPVIGVIATRPQDVPWALRPESFDTCPRTSVCWDLSQGTCSNPGCHCECTQGVFAGWDTWVLFLAVLMNTVQGWLVGQVTQRFSVIHRAIADAFSLLLIYFVGDPVFNGKSLTDAGLNLVALIVPLSTATFSIATGEMQRVFRARERLEKYHGNKLLMLDDSSDDDSEISLLASPSARHAGVCRIPSR